jgi:hypothetical protein
MEALQPLNVTALGVRHGLAGEGLFDRVRAADERPFAALLEARLLREGVGLYAVDWVRRVDWVENPLRADEELVAELGRMLALESMRLVTSIELHAEGLELDEAALALQRRTGLHLEQARLEARAALRDPLRGVGALGLLELHALERRLAGERGERWGLTSALKTVFESTELRPADHPIARERPGEGGR